MDDEKFQIRVHLGAHEIGLSVLRREEEIYRRAESVLRQKIERYNSMYGDETPEKRMALIAYETCVALARKQMSTDMQDVTDKLYELASAIDITLEN